MKLLPDARRRGAGHHLIADLALRGYCGTGRIQDAKRWWTFDIDRHHIKVQALRIDHQPQLLDDARWLDYLNGLEHRQIVHADVTTAAKLLWSNLRVRVSSLTLPDASPSNAGGLFLSWDRNGKHLEIEVLSDTKYEWFFRERATDISEGGPTPLPVGSIPVELLVRLNEVFDAGR